ncbi:Ctr copper transporter family domain-containing protein [Trichoderma ceciliae]
MDHRDHSHHVHSMEGHEGHGGHGGGGMDDMCSMSMLFTWDTTNLCIVFRQWHIRSNTSLVLSLIAVVLIGIGYEALRSVSRRYETSLATRLETVPNTTANGYRDNDNDENITETPAFNRSGQNRELVSKRGHVIKATLYAIQNFYAFMLMYVPSLRLKFPALPSNLKPKPRLVFMTYNGWVMVAVSLGAFFGYLLFGHATSAIKDNACH